MKPVVRVRVAPARSKIAVALMLLASAASATLVLALTLPWWVRAVMVAGCALQCALALQRLSSPPAVLAVAADRGVLAAGADGVERTGFVSDATYVSAGLTCLVWRVAGERLANVCLIAPDSLGVDERRELRVVLRWGRAPQLEAEALESAGEEVQHAPRKANAAGSPPESHAAASTHTPLSFFG